MAQSSKRYIDGFSCKLAFCLICNRLIDKSIRGRKNTCSSECEKLKLQDIDRKSYANQMSKDPDFAKKQSAKQYGRIKADPEKMEARRIAQNERMQMPNYKESARRSEKKYRSDPDVKKKIAERMRNYRYENIEIIAKVEAKRAEKRSLQREQLKINDPEKFQQLQDNERKENRRRKAEKRFSELQKDMEKMVNKYE